MRGGGVKSMFITRECDYAMRVVRALADGSRMSVNEICEKEDITAPFAYKILKKLQKSKIVKGFRGVHGGYRLESSLEELSLLDVYQAINPELFIIECLQPGYRCSRNENDQICKVHGALCQIQNGIEKMLSEQKFKDFV